VIVPIFRNDEEKSKVMPVIDQLKTQLSDFRIKVDDRTELTPGFKYNDWEMRGVPLRLEVGPKDVEKGSVMAARRDIPGRDGKVILPQSEVTARVKELLAEIQANLLQKAIAFRDSHIFEPTDYEDLKRIVAEGWAFAWWCGDPACEAKVKEDTKATTRCIPFDQPDGHGKCVVCGRDATEKVYFSKAY